MAFGVLIVPSFSLIMMNALCEFEVDKFDAHVALLTGINLAIIGTAVSSIPRRTSFIIETYPLRFINYIVVANCIPIAITGAALFFSTAK